MKIIAIQGDLLISKINKIPAGAKKREGKVLVWGEATGHAHQITAGEVFDYGTRLLFTAPVNTTIIHPDHDSIPLEKGDYEIVRQRQKSRKNMTALVVD